MHRDEAGKIVRELKAPSRPGNLINALKEPARRIEHIGLEAVCCRNGYSRPDGDVTTEFDAPLSDLGNEEDALSPQFWHSLVTSANQAHVRTRSTFSAAPSGIRLEPAPY